MRIRARGMLIGSLLIAFFGASLPARAQETSAPLQLPRVLTNSIHFGPANETLFRSSADWEADSESQSYNRRDEGFGIGVKGGFLFSTLSDAGNTNYQFSNNTGVMGGIFFGGNRPGLIGVMGELMYAKKGVNDSHGNTVVDLYYLEIPVLLRVNVGTSNLNGFLVYGIVGPVFDIKLKQSLPAANFNLPNDYQAFDIGVIGGAGVEITRFIVEGRYNWGLRNVVAGNLANTTTIHGRSFALLFGFRFN